MKTLGSLAAAVCVAVLAAAACGDDEATVRPRLTTANDGGVVGDGGTLSCGVALPTVYVSPSFDANAKVEKDFAARFEAIDAKAKATEGESTAIVTAAELKALYSDGSPSLRAVSTNAAQSFVDGYFDAYADAIGKTWTPESADRDGGAATGGKYAAGYYVSKTGLDLRAAATKVLLGGALFNHVLGLTSAPVSEASIDRLLAAFGATPDFVNGTSVDGGVDRLLAAYLVNRDDATSPTARRLRTALLTMKAAAAAGDKCRADLDAGVALFLREWERVTYGAAIFFLSSAAQNAAQAKGPESLHAFGEALGLIESFKGLPAERRKIQDANIDLVVEKIGEPFALIPRPGDRALKLNEAINDIALYEGFTPAEVDAFRLSL